MHVNIRKRKGERYFIMRKNQFRAIAGITTMSLFLGLGALAQPADVRAATVGVTIQKNGRASEITGKMFL